MRLGLTAALALAVCFPTHAFAQASFLRVMSGDTVPLPYASVSVRGAIVNVTDLDGRVSLGHGHRQKLDVEVRRIGFQPWTGTLELPDTAVVLTVTLKRLTQSLGEVIVTGRQLVAPELQGFYDRWLLRQKGTVSATFIGPEEIEKRHPSKISDMLSGLNGVALMRGANGGTCARGNGGSCFMAILMDGHTMRPEPPNVCVMAGSLHIGRGSAGPGDSGPDINQYLDADDVVAIEIYARGGNMPISLQVPDNACGVIAFWTGARR